MSIPDGAAADGLTPEGTDSTIGDEPTESGLGPEEIDDVTADGSAGDGTLGDGPLPEEPVSSTLGDAVEFGDVADTGGEVLPDELQGDAMGRPLEGTMNDDDQGMQNAGDTLGA